MNLLLIYFALVLLLILLGAFIVANFWRYRFQGDRTALVIILFTIAFFLVCSSTLFLLNPSALTNTTNTFDPSVGFQ
jgi:uncharacterized membrane protein